MKKLFFTIICIAVVLCGCGTANSDEHQKVTINMPEDNSVNDYRTEDKVNPDNIGWDDLAVSDKINTDNLYCGNKNSKKYHFKSCTALNNTKDENKVFYKTKEQYLENGFTPCQICNP